MQILGKVKKDIEFNKNFRSLLEVLKSIAVSQFHFLEKELKVFEKYEQVVLDFFASVDISQMEHPFLKPGDRPRTVVAVTSDQGLLGGLNMRVVSTAVSLMQSEREELVVIGDRGRIYARDKRVSFTAFPGIRDEVQQAQAMELRNYLFKRAIEGKIGALAVVYPRALSLVNQRVEMVKLLPYSKDQATSEEGPRVHFSQMILESTPEGVLEYLVYLLIGHKLKEVFSRSRLAELAARYMHLEESSQKIQDLTKSLKLKYFRLRHEMIDQSMRELFSARSIYAG